MAQPRGKHAADEEFDPIKLRAYELSKMKYYYAVGEWWWEQCYISIPC